ncbi:MAG: hypothetical protein ACTSRG_14020 [Candidatus Helarchaeota archaeon]
MFISEVRELILRFDIIIFLLTVEIGIVFIRQWVNDKKNGLGNTISLGFGLYNIFIAAGVLSYIVRRYYYNTEFMGFRLPESGLSSFLYLLSLSLFDIGVLVLTLAFEHEVGQFLKTRFIMSSFLIILIPFLIIFKNTPFFYPILILFAGSAASFIFIFMIYLAMITLGEIRNKIELGTIAFGIVLFGIMGMSDQGIQVLKNWFFNYQGILAIFELLAMFGLSLLYYSFFSFSLVPEAQWRGNLISLHIIDKLKGREVYKKNFMAYSEDKQLKEQILADGITSIIDMINHISKTDRKLNVIDKENIKIILDYGDKIITMLLAKMKLFNIGYFLHEVTEQFESNFSQFYDLWYENKEIFKPMDKIIKKMVPQI